MKYENNKIVYEIGDWVKCIDGENAKDNCGWTLGLIFKITDTSGNIAYGGKNGYGVFFCLLIPATQEEIDKALKNEKIMIGEYEVKFLGDGYGECHSIKVACQEIPKETFLKIGKKANWL